MGVDWGFSVLGSGWELVACARAGRRWWLWESDCGCSKLEPAMRRLAECSFLCKNNPMDLTWTDFEKTDMRVGTILEANDFPEARKPAYQLTIDFGPEIGIRKSSAQITQRYQKQDLVGRQIIGVVNFPKKQIGKFMSECLVLGAVGDQGDVVLLSPDFKVENGLRIG